MEMSFGSRLNQRTDWAQVNQATEQTAAAILVIGIATFAVGGDGPGAPEVWIFIANSSAAHHRILSPARLPFRWHWADGVNTMHSMNLREFFAAPALYSRWNSMGNVFSRISAD
jgi:hypothetical protein